MELKIMAQVIFPELMAAAMICASAANKVAVGADHIIEGEEWLVPVIDGGVFGYYRPVIQPTADAAPTTDAIRTVRLRNPVTGQPIRVIGTLANWVAFANGCCGTTPVMPDVVIVDPIVEEQPCEQVICVPGTGTYFFLDVAPPLTAGQKYLISGSANGVAFTPAASVAGYTSLALALAFAQASWGAYGTWSISSDGDGLQLVSTTTKTGSVKVSILPAP